MAATIERQLKILYVVTVGVTAKNLLKGQLRFLAQRGFDVHVACSDDGFLSDMPVAEGFTYHRIAITRRPFALQDLSALIELRRLIARLRPDIVNASTPKGAFLGLLAAWMFSIRNRIYLVRGLRLEGASGLARRVLWLFEWLTCRLATRVVCVSSSLKDKMVALALVNSEAVVLGSGSSNGVLVPPEARTKHLDSASGMPTMVFLGRVARDKGIDDLIIAMRLIWDRGVPCKLLIVGDVDASDPPDTSCLISDPRITWLPWVHSVSTVLRGCRALILPTKREGFPNVVLDAAVIGVPTVAYEATGVRDAIIDGSTGIVVPLGDREHLANAIETYATDSSLAARHGDRARQRASQEFRSDIVWNHWLDFYESLRSTQE